MHLPLKLLRRSVWVRLMVESVVVVVAVVVAAAVAAIEQQLVVVVVEVLAAAPVLPALALVVEMPGYLGYNY